MDIHISNSPPHLKITQTMIEDFIIDPVLGAKVIMNQSLDAFQKVRLKQCWWSPRVIDTSGFSSAKTFNLWMVMNLRALLIGDHICGIYYPSFQTGQLTFWKYFNEVAARAPIYRAQVGRNRVVGMDGKSVGDAKATNKGPSCWTVDYRNASQIMMPAPGFLQDANTQAGLRFNDLGIDEWTKIEASGSEGINKQLIGRTTRHTWNKWHPIFCNHHLLLATAEDTSHPSDVRYQSYLKEVASGNPDYAIISFSFKDYSDLPFKGGQTFREVFREDRVLKDMKKNKSEQGFLQEGLGIWSKKGKGLYTPDLLLKSKEVALREKLDIYCSRKDDPRGEKAHYFGGIDPAKADNKKADDGTIVILRAVLNEETAPTDLSAYSVGFCWAHRVRKADAAQWGGIIHKVNIRFGVDGWCLDPGGGGIWIRPELAKEKQVINGITQSVRPIACKEDESDLMVLGEFTLMMFKPQDLLVQQTWGSMNIKGQDNLTDIGHTEFIEGLRSGVGIPPSVNELGVDETRDWSPEKIYASKCLSRIPQQLSKIFVQVNDDGTTYYTPRNGARVFGCKGRKDFAYAGMMAYFRFLHWLRSGQGEIVIKPENRCMCAG